jgi:hypothetical protein
MTKRDQNMLLNLLETGMLVSTKIRKTQEMEFTGIKLFATSNDIERLSRPLRGRSTREIADKIASIVWYEMGTKDIRDALQLAKLVRSVDDLENVAGTIMKYKPK